MQRLPEQDIYVYEMPGEEVHKILVGDMDGKRLKAFAKKETATGEIVFKVIAEDAHHKTEVLTEGRGTAADFDREVNRLGEELLKPLGEAWREVQPKYLSHFNPKHPCPKH
ncbi:hypothetical protein Desca_0450 [Desulfotomaculum nigrificans CO-1-SRB]|uniref:Uncharacterized protein n=1 Tax=Desulfotomaculum nigrificans (strain DSM 14880 / VKM B-2319 / CO-1-SRB) TaxID=868595 RepID=F6B793_DESCC|nr:hypothetical protein [Desulfotomaculum nigrificans]AEF93343.1 hypothetical protein Desca_0450 [Desulfotomaculum nigrificans CO-1-SRB]